MSDDGTTFNVRVYRTEVYKGAEVTTYKVRWKVGARLWKEGFRNAAQADSFRSALLTAARKGDAFSLATGRPTAWERAKADISWYEFACAYVDMKWKQASAKYRKDIARALTAATPAMLAEARGRPDDASIRRALVRWGFNTKQRSDPPDDAAEVLDWVVRNTALVSTLIEPATARRMLDLATGTVDGRNAAASTARRHRIILANAMDYAVERGLLETNPIRVLKWTAPKVSSQVDRRSVVNPHQARALLDAVRAQQPSGPRAGRLLRGDVLRRAASRGSHQPQHRQHHPAASDMGRRMPAVAGPARGWRLGRAASAHRNARCGQRVDR